MRTLGWSLAAFVVMSCSVGPEAFVSEQEGSPVGELEQHSTATDLATARAMLTLLASPQTGRCNGCHTASPQDFRRWATALQNVEAKCLAPALTLSAAQRVQCLGTTSPTTGATVFRPGTLGFGAAGANLTGFRQLFTDAFGTDGATQHAAFARQVRMPRAGSGLTQAQYTRLRDWALRGLPQLDEALGNVPAPGVTCSASSSPVLTAHLDAMATTGWQRRNLEAGVAMFGCGTATRAADCLKTFPDVSSRAGVPGVTQTIRQLRELPFKTRYWVRGSADGRFVGFGLFPGAVVTDLLRVSQGQGAADIAVSADYDPVFFPGNDGFTFAGAQVDDGIRACRQSLLSDALRLTNPVVRLTESKCAPIANAVYQSIGTSLDGLSSLMVFGTHENDDGANDIIRPLPAAFGQAAKLEVMPLVSNGLAFRPQSRTTFALPNEGDAMLSPSSQLLVTRFGDGTKQLGYRVHRLTLGRTSSTAAPTVSSEKVAELCDAGGKAGFSFDERWLTFHQYVVGPQNSQRSNSADIVVADLRTGTRTKLTAMARGQYALYPHFRSDGWLYFLVRDTNTGREQLWASDFAVR